MSSTAILLTPLEGLTSKPDVEYIIVLTADDWIDHRMRRFSDESFGASGVHRVRGSNLNLRRRCDAQYYTLNLTGSGRQRVIEGPQLDS